MATPQQTQRQANPNAAMYDNTLFDIPNPEAIAAQERMALKAQQYQEALSAAKVSGQESLQFELANSRQAVGDSIGNLFGPKGDSAAVASAKKRAGILQGVMQETSNLSDPMERFGAIYEKLNAAGLTNDAERVRQKMLGLEEHKSELAGKAAEVANKTATTSKTNKDNSDRQRQYDALVKLGVSPAVLEKAMAEYDATGTMGKTVAGGSKFGDPVYGPTFYLKDDKDQLVLDAQGKPQLKQMIIEGAGKGKIVDPDAGGSKINVTAKGGNGGSAIVEKNELNGWDQYIKAAEFTNKRTEQYSANQAALGRAEEEVKEGLRTGNKQMINDGITKLKFVAVDIGNNTKSTGEERAAALKAKGLLDGLQEKVSLGLTGTNSKEFAKNTLDQSAFMRKLNREGAAREVERISEDARKFGLSGPVLNGVRPKEANEAPLNPVTSVNRDRPTILGDNEMKRLKDNRDTQDKPAGKVVTPKGGIPYIQNADGSRTYR